MSCNLCFAGKENTSESGAVLADAARRLSSHLVDKHLKKNGTLTGPDPGVRLNLRIGRFIKSYLRFLPWSDDHYYVQGQAYWVFDSLELYRLFEDVVYLDAALHCAEALAANQTSEGYWRYPQTEWTGRVATVEGCFGALGLLAGYEVRKEERFLEGAKRWYEYMIREVGFQNYDEDSIAVNYFSNVNRGLVPNNSTLALWFCAALARASGDDVFSEHCRGMVNFLVRCQLESGELPYALESEEGWGKTHYLCFQYNAFQLLDLIEYYALTNDTEIRPAMVKLAGFVAQGLTADGDARYNCHKNKPAMHYFTAAVSAALARATDTGLGDYSGAANRGYTRLLSVQRKDGAFDYSWGDYGLLSDRRSYPRNQAMILKHLLIAAQRDWAANSLEVDC